MGSAQLRTRRPIHLGRIIRSVGTGLSGLSLKPDYPGRTFGKVRALCRVLREGGLQAVGLSGPDYWENPALVPGAARWSPRGGRIVRSGQAGLSGLNLLLLQAFQLLLFLFLAWSSLSVHAPMASLART